MALFSKIHLVALIAALAVLVSAAEGWGGIAQRAEGAELTRAGGPTSSDELKRKKLEQEVRKLRLENRNSSGVRGFLSEYAGLLTGLAAIGGLVLTLLKQIREQANQRSLDRAQRKADRRQRRLEQEHRRLESQRLLEERFSAIMLDLGADSEAIRAGATVALLTFLRPEHATFHHQVRLVTLANLKVEHSAAVSKLLIRTFEAAMRTDEPFDPIELDFSGAELTEANLSNLQLDGANLSQARLRGANLSGTSLKDATGDGAILEEAICDERTSFFNATLPRARCAGARFHGAELVNAHFKGADLQKADFRGARMQAAHIEWGADLRGAKFKAANVADTYFRDAIFDDAALLSLHKADNLKPGHLSPADWERFKSLEPGSAQN